MSIETQAAVKTLKVWALIVLETVAIGVSVKYIQTGLLLAIIGVCLLGFLIYLTFQMNLDLLKDKKEDEDDEKFAQ